MLNTKTSQIVAAVILLVLGVVVGSYFLGGKNTVNTVERIVEKPLGGVTNFDELTLGSTVMDFQELELVAGDEESEWLNNTGSTVFVDLQTITTSGTASSSFRIYGLATSTSEIPASNDWAAYTTNFSTFMINAAIASSGAATTTNSIMAMNGGQGNGVIAVPAGWYFKLYLQRGDVNCKTDVAGAGAIAGACEAATSTNRGFNVQSIIRTIATSSPNLGQN